MAYYLPVITKDGHAYCKNPQIIGLIIRYRKTRKFLRCVSLQIANLQIVYDKSAKSLIRKYLRYASPLIANLQNFRHMTDRIKHCYSKKISVLFGPSIAKPPKLRPQVCSAKFELENLSQ
jgi:hypothetical protein